MLIMRPWKRPQQNLIFTWKLTIAKKRLNSLESLLSPFKSLAPKSHAMQTDLPWGPHGADAKEINLLTASKNLNSKVVDKEDPRTWVKYQKNSCKSCAATCCSMPIEVRWEDLVNLKLVNEDDLMQPLRKIVARLKKEKVITAHRKETGLFAMKQTREGKCRYLVGNRCSVYKNRPLVCRAFPIEMGWRHGFCPQKPIGNGLL